MRLLDTNAVIRYVYNDIPEQAEEIERLLKQGAEITIEVLAECVYVFQSVYGIPREEISAALEAFLGEVYCRRKKIARKALHFYSGHNLAFIDCVLLSEVIINDREIITFDKKLNKTIAEFS